MNMSTRRKRELEAKLTPKKRKAALMIVENELTAEYGDSRTQEDIADELQITRMTLYRWKTQDSEFVEYMNIIAKEFLDAHQAGVFRQLIKAINSSQPSIKGIELFLKLQGILKDVTVVEAKVDERSVKSINESIEELDSLLQLPNNDNDDSIAELLDDDEE